MHHDRDTVDFIRSKILPEIQIYELNAILFWNAKNTTEKGDLVWSPASKMIDELLEKSIILTENKETCCIQDGLYTQSHLHVLNFKTKMVVRHFEFLLEKIIQKFSNEELEETRDFIVKTMSQTKDPDTREVLHKLYTLVDQAAANPFRDFPPKPQPLFPVKPPQPLYPLYKH